MKGLHNESGQMLVMTAIELLLLIGFLALAVDVGVLFHTKRKMQIAVDAAATAGALHNYNAGFEYTGSYLTDAEAACRAIVQNGYATATDCAKAALGTPFAGSNGAQITIYEPPNDGYHTSSSSFVEVILSKPDPLYFFRVFSGQKTAMVAARAVAGDPEGAAGCIYTGNMYLGGNATIQGSQTASQNSCDTAFEKACGIYVNGTATTLDSGSVVCADFVNALAGSTTKFSTSPTATQLVQENPPQPYEDTYTPDPLPLGADAAMCTDGTNGTVDNTYTGTTFNNDSSTTTAPDSLPTPLTTYDYTATITDPNTGIQTLVSGGLQNVYCFSKNVTIGVSGSTDKFPAGFYVFEQGATFNGQVNFGQDPSTNLCNGTGTAGYGAVIYNYQGKLAMGGSQSQLAVCAPTNKTTTDNNINQYNGIAIMQPYPIPEDSTANSNVLQLVFGNSSMASGSCSLSDAALNGWIVAPGAPVYMHDQGGGVMVTGIVSASLGQPKSTGSDTETSGNGSFNGTMGVCNYNTVNSNTTPFKVINLVE